MFFVVPYRYFITICAREILLKSMFKSLNNFDLKKTALAYKIINIIKFFNN